MGGISSEDRQIIQGKLEEVKIALGEISNCLKRNEGKTISIIPIPHPIPPFPDKPGVCYPSPLAGETVTAQDFSIGIHTMEVWTDFMHGLV